MAVVAGEDRGDLHHACHPAAFLMLAREKAYLVAWPIFGTSNQLLASLTLLAASVWLIKTGETPSSRSSPWRSCS